MNIAQRLVEEATTYGLRLQLVDDRVQFASHANISPDFIERLREHHKEIALELSRFCSICFSSHALFGLGFDYRNPIKKLALISIY